MRVRRDHGQRYEFTVHVRYMSQRHENAFTVTDYDLAERRAERLVNSSGEPVLQVNILQHPAGTTMAVDSLTLLREIFPTYWVAVVYPGRAEIVASAADRSAAREAAVRIMEEVAATNSPVVRVSILERESEATREVVLGPKGDAGDEALASYFAAGVDRVVRVKPGAGVVKTYAAP